MGVTLLRKFLYSCKKEDIRCRHWGSIIEWYKNNPTDVIVVDHWWRELFGDIDYDSNIKIGANIELGKIIYDGKTGLCKNASYEAYLVLQILVSKSRDYCLYCRHAGEIGREFLLKKMGEHSVAVQNYVSNLFITPVYSSSELVENMVCVDLLYQYQVTISVDFNDDSLDLVNNEHTMPPYSYWDFADIFEIDIETYMMHVGKNQLIPAKLPEKCWRFADVALVFRAS